MRCAACVVLGVWLGLLLAQRWQAAGAEVERVRANRNPMVRKDDW